VLNGDLREGTHRKGALIAGEITFSECPRGGFDDGYFLVAEKIDKGSNDNGFNCCYTDDFGSQLSGSAPYRRIDIANGEQPSGRKFRDIMFSDIKRTHQCPESRTTRSCVQVANGRPFEFRASLVVEISLMAQLGKPSGTRDA
jgi:hypothetical protein